MTTKLNLDARTWEPTDPGWVNRPTSDDRMQIWDLDGTPWNHAAIPRRWHKCSTHTCTVVNWFTTVHRCACGARSLDGRHWLSRNGRRRAEA